RRKFLPGSAELIFTCWARSSVAIRISDWERCCRLRPRWRRPWLNCFWGLREVCRAGLDGAPGSGPGLPPCNARNRRITGDPSGRFKPLLPTIFFTLRRASQAPKTACKRIDRTFMLPVGLLVALRTDLKRASVPVRGQRKTVHAELISFPPKAGFDVPPI